MLWSPFFNKISVLIDLHLFENILWVCLSLLFWKIRKKLTNYVNSLGVPLVWDLWFFYLH
jgi:hypothetical protein